MFGREASPHYILQPEIQKIGGLSLISVYMLRKHDYDIIVVLVEL